MELQNVVYAMNQQQSIVQIVVHYIAKNIIKKLSLKVIVVLAANQGIKEDKMIINGKAIYKIYISGAITNNPNYKKEFEAAEKAIIAAGLIPLSPIRTESHMAKRSERCCMFDDLKLMEEADAVLEIPKRKTSEGSTIENLIAKKCSMPIITMEDINK